MDLEAKDGKQILLTLRNRTTEAVPESPYSQRRMRLFVRRGSSQYVHEVLGNLDARYFKGVASRFPCLPVTAAQLVATHYFPVRAVELLTF